MLKSQFRSGSAAPVANGAGKPTLAGSTAILPEYEQASQYARSLIEASLDPLVTISAEGKITDVNAGSIKITGIARENLIGTDFSDYCKQRTKIRPLSGAKSGQLIGDRA